MIQQINYCQKFIFLNKKLERIFDVKCTPKESIEATMQYAKEQEDIFAVERRDEFDVVVDFSAIRSSESGELCC